MLESDPAEMVGPRKAGSAREWLYGSAPRSIGGPSSYRPAGSPKAINSSSFCLTPVSVWK